MVEVDAIVGYLALGFCAWTLASSLVCWSSKSPHKFPPTATSLLSSNVHVLRRYFVTSHGLALYVHKWLPRFDTRPKGVLFILHGLGEHAGRYDHIARVMVTRGFAVFAVDHQGHGRSDGERMFATKTQHLSEDFLEFVQHVLQTSKSGDNFSVLDPEVDAHAQVDWKRLPRFVLGHSMGGVLALQLLELSMQQDFTWTGVIVSSPPLWTVPGGGCPGILKLLARVLPRLQLPPFEFAKLGDDSVVQTRWVRDPLMPKHGATTQLMCSLLCEGDRFSKSDNALAKNFPAPLYMLHGEQDALTLSQGSVNFYTMCTHEDKTLNVVPGAVHEVLNLGGHEKVLEDIIGWMEARSK
ncbi:hypothetical protein PHYBOEH_001136 [Phytophthora boehmeriae]|uniref:Serine aminopeptidase S33 domain-containing protein n=1 Tax=Phytophthora boehmeriae TaxID=109152 RepID=A0A8T1WTR0_9STRA|nr:hypothetical protein PHYBOEH_001136 [Phytophthora boehmeriae]